jgi:alkylmercury lyase-like protein
MDTKTLWAGVLGMAIGAAVAVGTRGHWAKALDECKTGCKTRAPAPIACPARYDDGKLTITDAAGAERLRASLMSGVFVPWFELGRAPTPEEIGQRLSLDAKRTNALLDQLSECGESIGFGVKRVPESELLAVAWPLANVPTGIDVTLEGEKTVHARCAIDALGISKMMGKKATVEATTKDGAALKVEVDGEQLVSSSLPEAVVYKGPSCDEMVFFSSQAALDKWKAANANANGRGFKLDDAVRWGAEHFGRYAQPIRG